MNYLFLSLALFICKDGIGQQKLTTMGEGQAPIFVTGELHIPEYDSLALSWDMFKAKPPKDELSVIARTYTALGFASEDGYHGHSSRVFPQFLESLSWVRVKTPEGLRHENCHWQICQLEAALCNQDLQIFQGKVVKSSRPEQSVFQFYQWEIDRLNESFDKETNHSNNKEAEERWEQSISAQLRQLQ